MLRNAGTGQEVALTLGTCVLLQKMKLSVRLDALRNDPPEARRSLEA